MLGRLRMSVEECITAYSRLMKRIFEKRENRSIMGILGRVKPRFSSEALEEAFKDVLTSSGHRVDEKFEEIDEPMCKVYVLSLFRYVYRVSSLIMKKLCMRAVPKNERDNSIAKLHNSPEQLQSHHPRSRTRYHRCANIFLLGRYRRQQLRRRRNRRQQPSQSCRRRGSRYMVRGHRQHQATR
jgi:hypothetical protein